MGTISLDSADISKKYGMLGVRFNSLREFYNCVRKAHNSNNSVTGCYL